jgi:hypothetical protein
MPHAPIEILGEGEYIHLASEGQWLFRVGERMVYHKKDGPGYRKNSVDTEGMYKVMLANVRKYLKDILKSNAKSWAGEHPLLYPNWTGWADIDREALKIMAKKSIGFDATLN